MFFTLGFHEYRLPRTGIRRPNNRVEKITAFNDGRAKCVRAGLRKCWNVRFCRLCKRRARKSDFRTSVELSNAVDAKSGKVYAKNRSFREKIIICFEDFDEYLPNPVYRPENCDQSLLSGVSRKSRLNSRKCRKMYTFRLSVKGFADILPENVVDKSEK